MALPGGQEEDDDQCQQHTAQYTQQPPPHGGGEMYYRALSGSEVAIWRQQEGKDGNKWQSRKETNRKKVDWRSSLD